MSFHSKSEEKNHSGMSIKQKKINGYEEVKEEHESEVIVWSFEDCWRTFLLF